MFELLRRFYRKPALMSELCRRFRKERFFLFERFRRFDSEHTLFTNTWALCIEMRGRYVNASVVDRAEVSALIRATECYEVAHYVKNVPEQIFQFKRMKTNRVLRH